MNPVPWILSLIGIFHRIIIILEILKLTCFFQSQTENFLKEALNIAVLTFGITFRWKLSKLIQSSFLKDILNKIFDNLSLDFIVYLYIFIGVTPP